jgi:hypothetical protein
MTLAFHKLPTPFLCLVLLGVLSGCASGLEGIFFPLEDLADEARKDSPSQFRTGKNYYKPVILTSSESVIRIKYLSVGPNAEHEQVTQLISDHCDGAYIETSRVELRGYTTVDAECNRPAAALSTFSE